MPMETRQGAKDKAFPDNRLSQGYPGFKTGPEVLVRHLA